MNALFAPFCDFVRFRPVTAGSLALTVLLGAANGYLWNERRAVALEHDEVRHRGELMLTTLAHRARIDTDLAALQAAIAQIERNLLDEQSMEVNLGYFYRMEKPARVRLVRLNQLAAPPPLAKSSFKTVPFSMQVTGSYRNAMTYLRALETGPRILCIKHCSFERSSVDSGEFVLDLTVEILAKI